MALWDNTIVIFTTDHGMSLGEHNRTGKSNINDDDDRRWPLYPEVAHIPFLIAAPGLDGGREVAAMAQPADILPTLLDLAGLDVTPPEPFHGRIVRAGRCAAWSSHRCTISSSPAATCASAATRFRTPPSRPCSTPRSGPTRPSAPAANANSSTWTPIR